MKGKVKKISGGGVRLDTEGGRVKESPDAGAAETGDALAIKLQSQMREQGGN